MNTKYSEWPSKKREILSRYIGYFHVNRGGYLQNYYGYEFATHISFNARIEAVQLAIDTQIDDGPFDKWSLYRLVRYALTVLQNGSYYMGNCKDSCIYLSERNRYAIQWMVKLAHKLEQSLGIETPYTDGIVACFQCYFGIK